MQTVNRYIVHSGQSKHSRRFERVAVWSLQFGQMDAALRCTQAQQNIEGKPAGLQWLCISSRRLDYARALLGLPVH